MIEFLTGNALGFAYTLWEGVWEKELVKMFQTPTVYLSSCVQNYRLPG